MKPSTFPRLPAKSVRQGEEPTLSHLLLGHLQDVHAAAVEVLRCTGDEQLQALGLPPEHFRERLDRVVRFTALGEKIAEKHLQHRGFRVLARNFRTRFGELDLIVADQRTLVFCEAPLTLV